MWWACGRTTGRISGSASGAARPPPAGGTRQKHANFGHLRLVAARWRQRALPPGQLLLTLHTIISLCAGNRVRGACAGDTGLQIAPTAGDRALLLECVRWSAA